MDAGQNQRFLLSFSIILLNPPVATTTGLQQRRG